MNGIDYKFNEPDLVQEIKDYIDATRSEEHTSELQSH